MTTDTMLEKREGGEVAKAEPTWSGRTYQPNVDILERRDELVVLAEMPGADPDQIDVNFESGTLSIHGKVRERLPENTSFLLREYGIGDFYREFRVGEVIDSSRITAEYIDGVLTLHLPKVEAAKPRKISVKTR